MGKVQELYLSPEPTRKNAHFPMRIVHSSTQKNQRFFQSREHKLPLNLQAASQPHHLEMLYVAASCQGSQFTASRSALFHSCLESWTMFLSHVSTYHYHFCAFSPALALNKRPPRPSTKSWKSLFRYVMWGCRIQLPASHISLQGRSLEVSTGSSPYLPLLELCWTNPNPPLTSSWCFWGERPLFTPYPAT